MWTRCAKCGAAPRGARLGVAPRLDEGGGRSDRGNTAWVIAVLACTSSAGAVIVTIVVVAARVSTVSAVEVVVVLAVFAMAVVAAHVGSIPTNAREHATNAR